MKLYNEDCLTGMAMIPTGSVDLILTDLPYGTTDAPFDKRLPFEPMWEQFKRVTKLNAAIVLFSQMPFGAELIMSNLKMFRYEWIWRKNLATGFLNAKKMPLKSHENILVFYRKLPTYNPQFTQGKPYYRNAPVSQTLNYGKKRAMIAISDGRRYPVDIVDFMQVTNISPETNYHPQQKPVDLLEYLIKTYTDAGETVLDATMGSGSTGVACANTGRKFIGFETETRYYDIAVKRINEALDRKRQELFEWNDEDEQETAQIRE